MMVRSLLFGGMVLLTSLSETSGQSQETLRIGIPAPTARPLPSNEELQRFLEPIDPFAKLESSIPHEGATIDIPYVIATPDLLEIQVLEALPGRPITGHHLVRPDGTISLGFYGQIYVRGLTLEQAKVKIILHLRRFLTDETLGFFVFYSDEDDEGSAQAKPSGESPQAAPPTAKGEGNAAQGSGASHAPRRRWRKSQQDQPVGSDDQNSGEGETLPSPRKRPDTGPKNRSNPPSADMPVFPVGEDPFPDRELEEDMNGILKFKKIHPADSDRVFIDVSTYYSQKYAVQGTVAKPGLFTIGGHQCVSDALLNAELLPTSDVKNVKLIRPARNGKPAKVYSIDYEAIVERGDSVLNYQIFPGDRIFVGTNPLDKAASEIERVAKSQRTMIDSMLAASFLWNSLGSSTEWGVSGPAGWPIRLSLFIGSHRWSTEMNAPNTKLSRSQQESFVKSWVEFWSKAGIASGGLPFDEKIYREALLRQLMPPAAEKK